jgi:hypothetical protein
MKQSENKVEYVIDLNDIEDCELTAEQKKEFEDSIIAFTEYSEKEIKFIIPKRIPPSLTKEQWIKISTEHLTDFVRTML